MKSIYIIQYDQLNPETIINRIKSLGSWIEYFPNCWLLESDLNSKDIYEKLSIDFENASIFIIELDLKNYYGRMNTKVWDWIKARRSK